MPTQVIFTPYPAAIAQMLSQTGMVGIYIRGLGEAVAAQARTNAPRDTGELANSIRVEMQAVGVDVVVDVEHATSVIKGTRPHVIAAKGGGVLRFPSKRSGAVVYRRRVNHPGTQPNPFLTDALAAVVLAI